MVHKKIKHCGIISSSRAVHADGTKVHHVFIDLWDVVKLITKICYLGSPVLRENVSRAANIFQHVNGLIIYYMNECFTIHGINISWACFRLY